MQPKLKKTLKKQKKYYYCKIQKMRSFPSRKQKIKEITLNLIIKEIQSFHTFEKTRKMKDFFIGLSKHKDVFLWRFPLKGTSIKPHRPLPHHL